LVSGKWVCTRRMKRIGVIAAMPGELKPLVQGWKPLRTLKGVSAWQGTIDGATCIAVCAGMGKEAAERACAVAAQDAPLTALVSAGWAGALSCGLQPGGAYVVNEVVDVAGGERFVTSSPPRAGEVPPFRLVTIDHVAPPAEKRRLAERYQAVLVDMEASSVARFAGRQGIAFYCLKAVSDVAGEMLPDFSRYTDNQGQLQLGALLAHVAIRPRYWPGLARIGKNGRRGAVAMAAALGPMMGSA
jgi:adenosylhomocysteine nucleosidase